MIQAIPPEEIRRVTENVLNGPEFQRSLDLWMLLFDAFRRFLNRISEWAVQNPDAARVLSIGLTIVLILLLTHIVYTVVREFASLRNPSALPDARERPLQALEGIATNWSDAFQLARAALESGDLYRALWITHRVLLSALDRMDVLRFARWKTNRDYIQECREDHEASKTLSDVTAAYEQVVYAHGDIQRDRAESLLSRVEALVHEAGR